MKFPNTVAAADARAKHLRDAEGKDLWLLGAAVIKDCGGAAKFGIGRGNGTRDETSISKTCEAISKELAKHGHVYTGPSLYKIASTVAAFPADTRRDGVNFFIHSEAKNPDLLGWIIKQHAKEQVGKPADEREILSGRIARDLVTQWHTLQANKHREMVEEAKAKKKAATTLEDKRAARDELKKLGGAMPTPKTHLPAPDENSQTELAEMSDILRIDAEAMSVARTLRTNLAALRDVGEINPDFVGSLIEHHETVVEVAKQIVSVLKDAKRSRFAAIEGGKSA